MQVVIVTEGEENAIGRGGGALSACRRCDGGPPVRLGHERMGRGKLAGGHLVCDVERMKRSARIIWLTRSGVVRSD